MDNNSQFQLRESAMNVDGNIPLPIVEPLDLNTSGDGDGTDTGGGATVTTPTNTIKDEPEPTPLIIEPIPEKPETGYDKAERYANLSIRWAIVLVMLALTYNLVKQYKVPKPTAPTA